MACPRCLRCHGGLSELICPAKQFCSCFCFKNRRHTSLCPRTYIGLGFLETSRRRKVTERKTKELASDLRQFTLTLSALGSVRLLQLQLLRASLASTVSRSDSGYFLAPLFHRNYLSFFPSLSAMRIYTVAVCPGGNPPASEEPRPFSPTLRKCAGRGGKPRWGGDNAQMPRGVSGSAIVTQADIFFTVSGDDASVSALRAIYIYKDRNNSWQSRKPRKPKGRMWKVI